MKDEKFIIVSFTPPKMHRKREWGVLQPGHVETLKQSLPESIFSELVIRPETYPSYNEAKEEADRLTEAETEILK